MPEHDGERGSVCDFGPTARSRRCRPWLGPQFLAAAAESSILPIVFSKIPCTMTL